MSEPPSEHRVADSAARGPAHEGIAESASASRRATSTDRPIAPVEVQREHVRCMAPNAHGLCGRRATTPLEVVFRADVQQRRHTIWVCDEHLREIAA